jgi:hypothetical protein
VVTSTEDTQRQGVNGRRVKAPPLLTEEKGGRSVSHSRAVNDISKQAPNFKKNLKTKIYKYIILTVFYGYETWSLTLREEHRLRVSENRFLKRKFEPQEEDVAGRWISLQNEKLHNLYASPNIVRVSNQGG